MKRSRVSSPCSIRPSRCSQSPVSPGEVSGCSPSSRIDVEALLRRDERAAVALDVADVDQPLDDRRARGRRADARVLHRLAQLVVVDELARGLHRGRAATRRSSGAAAWSPSRRRRPRACRTASPCSSFGSACSAPSSSSAPRAVVEALAVDAAPARHEQHAAAGAEHVLGDRRLQPRVLEHGVGMEDGEEAAGDQVVDAPVVVAHLLDAVLGARRDDRVVVGDLRVVDDAAERQRVEPGHVGRGAARTRARLPTSSAVGLISPAMSPVRKRELVRG